MELHQLRYFVAVAEEGGFSRAATRCQVAQPSLSQQIKKLEAQLGRRLFDRLGRTTTLTEAGAALLPRAKEILAAVRDVEEHLGDEVESGHGPLAVGAIPTMAPYVLPPAVERLQRKFPGCRLTLREDLTERVIDAVVANELDCAIVSTPIDHELVELDVLGRERLLVAASKDTPLPQTERLKLADLQTAPMVVIDEVHCLGQQIREFCSARGVQRRIVCRSTQLSTVQHLVGLGLGISLVPEMAARADDSRERRYLPLSRNGPGREVAVAWRKNRSRSMLAKVFVALVRDELATLR